METFRIVFAIFEIIANAAIIVILIRRKKN